MRKEIKSEEVSYEYYCDLCKKELWVDRSHDDRISDYMDKCPLCNKEVCHACQRDIPYLDSQGSNNICRVCAEKYADILAKLAQNAKSAWATERELKSELFSHRIKEGE